MNGVINGIVNGDVEYQTILRKSDVYSGELDRMDLPNRIEDFFLIPLCTAEYWQFLKKPKMSVKKQYIFS